MPAWAFPICIAFLDEHLLFQGARVDESSESHEGPELHPLVAVCEYGHPKLVKMLIDAGGSIMHQKRHCLFTSLIQLSKIPLKSSVICLLYASQTGGQSNGSVQRKFLLADHQRNEVNHQASLHCLPSGLATGSGSRIRILGLRPPPIQRSIDLGLKGMGGVANPESGVRDSAGVESSCLVSSHEAPMIQLARPHIRSSHSFKTNPHPYPFQTPHHQHHPLRPHCHQ